MFLDLLARQICILNTLLLLLELLLLRGTHLGYEDLNFRTFLPALVLSFHRRLLKNSTRGTLYRNWFQNVHTG